MSKKKNKSRPTFNYLPEKFFFGQHPDFRQDLIECRTRAKQGNYELFFGRQVRISEIKEMCLEEVVFLPRNKCNRYLDDFDDEIGLNRITLPFSTYDFYLEHNEDSLLCRLKNSQALLRTGGINQLGYLIAPLTEKECRYETIHYVVPFYPHTRWLHQLQTGVLAAAVLARNGFSYQERTPVVLAAASHDIATPAGGDSIKRIDPANLDEEENYPWSLDHYSITDEWRKECGFDIERAAGWVKGRGIMGHLLDICDKISYTALDCSYIGGWEHDNLISHYGYQYPLVIDVWQDIRFTPDRTQLYFADPSRLYSFLYLRALEHRELLFNPRCRSLDFFLTEYAGRLYRQGIITREDLLTRDNRWLDSVLQEYFPEKFYAFMSPDLLEWRKFSTKEKRDRFCRMIGQERIDHIENTNGFKTGLNWLVLSKNKIVPLREAIDDSLVKRLEHMSRGTAGYWVYYKKKKYQ